jgi:hypothetical protein
MDQEPYPAEKTREGEIVLNAAARCVIFVACLVGTVVPAFILTIAH